MLRAADLFCGAGGTSAGARSTGGAEIVFALNHWDRAIETHSANFPGTVHVNSRLEDTHPERSARLTGNAATDLEIGAMRPTISIERKSKADAASTILGWGDRRDNFKQELAILSGLNFGAIVIECTEQELIYDAPEFGIKSAEENGKTIESSIESWRIEFNRVQWVFCGDRVEAERKVYRLLAKFWEECSK